MILIAQIPTPSFEKPPGDSLETWVIWVFGLTIIILGGAIIALYKMGLSDNNRLLAEKDKTEAKAQKLCDEKDDKIDSLEKENRSLLDKIADLRQKLGAAGVKE